MTRGSPDLDLDTDGGREAFAATLPRRLVDVPRRRAAGTPGAPVVYAGGEIRTYGDLAAGIDAAADVLRAAGVRGGDRVALVLENGFAGICFFYATTALDAWAVMANARLSPREIGVIAGSAGARLAVYAAGDAPERHPHAAGAAVRHEDPRFGAVALGPRDAAAAPEPVHDDPARQVAAMLYTSGTTGRPKGAMLSHRAMLYQSAIVSRRRGYGPDDCPCVVAPIVHVLGLCGMLLPVIYAGGAVDLATTFDADAVSAALASGRLTRLYGAPPMIAALAARGEAAGGRIAAPRLKEVLAGGAPVDQALRDRVARAFGMPLGIGYAATECTPIAASTPAEPANPGAVGRPWPGMDVAVFDSEGKRLAAGETGEVRCRGPHVMLGYYRDPDATAAAIDAGGWVATGDLGFVDADGQVHLVGRLKDLILRSGFNVYPAEVEAVLNTHPDILQSAVVGRAVPGNEEVVAFVEPRPGARPDVAAVAEYAAQRLAPYKRPAEIVVLAALPVGPTGKLSKTVLRERAATPGTAR